MTIRQICHSRFPIFPILFLEVFPVIYTPLQKYIENVKTWLPSVFLYITKLKQVQKAIEFQLSRILCKLMYLFWKRPNTLTELRETAEYFKLLSKIRIAIVLDRILGEGQSNVLLRITNSQHNFKLIVFCFVISLQNLLFSHDNANFLINNRSFPLQLKVIFNCSTYLEKLDAYSFYDFVYYKLVSV